MKNMSNSETRLHLLNWVKMGGTNSSNFSWPTDACGYDQHLKFIEHHKKNWCGGTIELFAQFIIDYANSLKEEKMIEKNELVDNSPQQLQAEIRALIEEFCDLYDGDLSNEAVSLLLTKLRELTAVRCEKPWVEDKMRINFKGGER